jgi:hypothetical protein
VQTACCPDDTDNDDCYAACIDGCGNSTSTAYFPPGTCTTVDVQKDINEAVLSELQIQLATLFLTAIIIQNTLEVLLPAIPGLIQSFKNRRNAPVRVEASPEDNQNQAATTSAAADDAKVESEVEEQMKREPFHNTIDDMAELIVQFGYVTLFVMALPLTPLLALINNIVEMKVDAINLVRQSQRPNPDGSYGLGSWNNVLGFFSIIAVGTNVGLITFRSGLVTEIFEDDPEYKWIFFSIVSILLALIVGFEKWVIPDVPIEVEQAIERQRLIENVLVLGANIDPDADDPPEGGTDFKFDPAVEFITIETLQDIPIAGLNTGNATSP